MQFTNEIGRELFGVLSARVDERLGDLPGMARFSALPGAAIVPVVEILRGPAGRRREPGATADKLIAIAGNPIRVLLEDVIAGARR